jgi:protein-S-isoprenylcysteine O-methyltransferase Ste14
VGGALARFVPWSVGAAFEPFRLPGALIFGLSAMALGAVTIRTLRRAGTSVEPGAAPVRLVSHGPYRLSRHPLYLAQPLLLLGFACATGSVWFVAAAAVVTAALDRWVIVPEERDLEACFGDAFREYRGRVRRWL